MKKDSLVTTFAKLNDVKNEALNDIKALVEGNDLNNNQKLFNIQEILKKTRIKTDIILKDAK